MLWIVLPCPHHRLKLPSCYAQNEEQVFVYLLHHFHQARIAIKNAVFPNSSSTTASRNAQIGLAICNMNNRLIFKCSYKYGTVFHHTDRP